MLDDRIGRADEHLLVKSITTGKLSSGNALEVEAGKRAKWYGKDSKGCLGLSISSPNERFPVCPQVSIPLGPAI